MSIESRNKPNIQDEGLVRDLMGRLLAQGEGILNGKSKLVLTATILDQLNQQFMRVDWDTHDDITEDPSTSLVTACGSHSENVQYLHEFVKKVPALEVVVSCRHTVFKIISPFHVPSRLANSSKSHNVNHLHHVTNACRTLQGSVNIAQFSSLRILELRRIPVHLFAGLQSLRTRLQMISCSRCLHSLEDLFSTCGGDRSSPFTWPELISANLSFNTIESMDSSLDVYDSKSEIVNMVQSRIHHFRLKLVPSLVYLDLSHNALKSTQAIEFLTELEYLNLSYNQLEQLPNISSRACARLKVLSVRHNSITNLSKLSSLINLQQVDLAYNCLMEHSVLQPFASLYQLNLICLEGNPLFFQSDHRKQCLNYLHTPTTSFILDGRALSKGEVKVATASDLQHYQHQRQPRMSTNGWCSSRQGINNDISSSDVSLRQVCASPVAGESTNQDGRCRSDSVRTVATRCGRTKNKSRRTPVTREVLIDDEGNGSGDETVTINNTRNGAMVAISKSLDTSLEDDGLVRVRQEVARCRQQLGSDWLTVGARMHMFPGTMVAPARDPDEEITRMFGGGVAATDPEPPEPPNVEAARVGRSRESNRVSQTSDDVFVLSTESAPPLLSASVERQGDAVVLGDVYSASPHQQIEHSQASEHFLWNQLSPNDGASSESDDELDDAGEEQTFIVDMEKPGSTEPTSIILVIGETELREKDSTTGRTVERLDLKSISSVESVETKTMGEDGVVVQMAPQIRVTFNYSKRDRRERLYTSLDKPSFQELFNCLKPIADENTYEEMAVGALQCLKCSSQFSKEVAKRVIRRSQLPQPDDAKVLSRSAEIAKGFLSEANACPNCGSEMIIELSDSSLPSAGKSSPASLGTSSSRTAVREHGISAPLRQNQSTPIPPSSSWNPVNTLGPSQPLGASCPTSTTVSQSPAKSDYLSACNGCTIVRVEAEVHVRRSARLSDTELDEGSDSSTPRSEPIFFPRPDSDGPSSSLGRTDPSVVTGVLRRCESDITILSNPSQSSIQVMPAPNQTESTLDAISENSNDFNWMLNQQGTTTGRDSPTALSVGGSDRARRPATLGSASSGSNNGSLCTTVYKSAVANSQRSETPESFLSAVSSSEDRLSARQTTEQADESDDESTELVPDGQGGDSASCTLEGSTAEADGDRQASITWSCRYATVKFSFQDFSQLDHRIKLYLIMHVLGPNEEIVCLLRAGIVPYTKGNELPGLLIFSNWKVYVLKITGQESDQPGDWLEMMGSYQCSSLLYLNVGLGNQCFQLEFGPKSTPNCFTVILRDADHCNNFVSFFTDKIKSGCLDVPESQVQFILDGDESLQTIRELLLLPCKTSEASGDHSETNDTDVSIRLYTMCYWIPQDRNFYEPISLVMTSTDLHAFTENMHWPLPHLIVPSTEILSEAQLVPRDKHKIQDLTRVEQVKDRFLELVLKFWDEDAAEESTWHIAMETRRSLQAFIIALKDPWERMFGVELEISIVSETST